MGSSPTLAEFLEAANATYSRTVPVGLTALLDASGNPVVSNIDSDGFYAEAFIDNAGHVIISYEGTTPPIATTPSGTNYGFASIAADTSLFLGQVPNALIDANAFSTRVIGIAQAQGFSTGDVFVTGHSLGGAEAEAGSVNLLGGVTLGGITFGAPGISSTIIAGATNPKLIDYVDYGDPVGNFGNDTKAGVQYTPLGVQHVGQVEMVGAPTNGASLVQEAVAFHDLSAVEQSPVLFGVLQRANVVIAGALVTDLVAVAATQTAFHSLGDNYAPDLNLSLFGDGAVLANGSVGPVAHAAFGVDQIPAVPYSSSSEVVSSSGQLQKLSVTDTDGTSNVVNFGLNGSLLFDSSYNASNQLTNTIQVNADNSEVDTLYNLDGGPLQSETLSFGSSGQLANTTETFANGDSIAFDQKTETGLSFNNSTGMLDATLVTPNSSTLATLELDAETDTGALGIGHDGFTVALNSVPTSAILVDPVDTPEQVLLDYLTDLGSSTTAAELNQAHHDYLHPTGTSYTVSGNIEKVDDTHANVIYSVNGTPGAIVAGQGTAVITDMEPGVDSHGNPIEVPVEVNATAANLLHASGDISQDSITGVPELDVSGGVTLTNAQFNQFDIIKGDGTITAADSGTFDLNAANIDPSATFSGLTATDWNGTTLIGNDADGQILTASLFGNDTLHAGNGVGDILVASEGVDSIAGGTGGDTFIVSDGLAVGSAIAGNGSNNVLQAEGDLSLATISGVQTLDVEGDAALNPTELNGFTSIQGSGEIEAAVGGTYDFIGKFSTPFTISALSNDGTTLTGSSIAGEHLIASSSGNDTLTEGNGGGFTLEASGTSGNNILTAGDGGGDTLDVSNSSGDNTLNARDTVLATNTVGAGGEQATVYLDADDSSGNNSLTTGDGTRDLITAQNSVGDNVLTEGNGTVDIIDVSSSDGDNHLTVGNGNNAILNAENTFGDNVLTAGNGNGDILIADGGIGDNRLIAGDGNTDSLEAIGSGDNFLQAGNGNNDVLNAFTSVGSDAFSTGNNTLIAGSGSNDNLNVEDSSGNNSLTANGDSATLNAEGTTGNNALTGNAASDFLTVGGSGGANTLTAGDSDGDILDASSSTGDNVLKVGNGNNVILSAESSSGNNHLTAGDGHGDVLTAESATGNNILIAGNGDNDTLSAGNGNDTLTVGSGVGDVLNTGTGIDILNGGNGGDTFQTLFGTPAAGSEFHGGAGNDTLEAGGDLSGDTITGIETLETNLVTLTATELNSFTTITGNGGLLEITAANSGGTFSLAGKTFTGAAEVELQTTSSNDTTLIANDADNEILNAKNSTANNTLEGGNGANQELTGGSGNDILTAGAGANQYVAAGSGNDILTGGSGDGQELAGGSGNDTLTAGTGTNQILVGGEGANTLIANNVGDTLIGGTGADTMIGGTGNDTFFAGLGNASMQSNGGNDSYVFVGPAVDASYSIDDFHTDAGQSFIVFQNDVDPFTGETTADGAIESQVTFTQSGNDLVLTIEGIDPITVQNYFTAADDKITGIQFADGTTLTSAQIDAMFASPTPGEIDSQNVFGQIVDLAELPTVGTVLGTGLSFDGSGDASHISSHTTTGQLDISEFDGSGNITFAEALTGTGGTTAFDVASGTTLVDTAQNLLGDGGFDIVLQPTSGQATIAEFNIAGQELASHTETASTVASGGSATVSTANELVAATSAAISLAANTNGDTVQGNSNTITVGNNDTFNVGGSNDTVTMGTNDTATILSGTGHVVTMTDDLLGADSGVAVTVNGEGNGIGGAAGDTITIGSNGEFGWSDEVDMVTGTINVVANASITVVGGNNAIAGGTDDQIGIVSGDHNTVSAGTGSDVWIEVGNSTVITESNSEVDLNTNVINASIIGSNDTVDGSNGDNFNITGSNETVAVSHSTIYLNAGDTNVAITGSNDTIHIRSGDTYTISGSSDTVITDTVMSESNGSTINHFNGSNNLIDLASLTYDSSITVTESLNAGHTSGTLTIADHGTTVDTLTLTNITSIGSFNIRTDGSGGTLLVDPPDGSTDTVTAATNSPHDGFRFADVAHEVSSPPPAVSFNGDQFVFHANNLTQPGNQGGAPAASPHTTFDNFENLKGMAELLDAAHTLPMPEDPANHHLQAVHGHDGFHLV